MRGSHFRNPTTLLALGHPFGSPPHPQVMGMPLCIDLRTGEPLYLDPFLLKDQGYIKSNNGVIIGHKGYGKSATMKIIFSRLAAVSAGYGLMRGAINDHKSEGTAGEYARLSQTFRSKVFAIGSMSVNPFESRLGMSELNILEMAQLLCNFALGHRLIGAPDVALQVAVHRMLALDESLWSPHTLHAKSLMLTDEDIHSYYNGLKHVMLEQAAQRVNLLDGTLKYEVDQQLAELRDGQFNYSVGEIKAGGVTVANLLSHVLHGSFGTMFGNSHSMYDLYTQRVVTKDWRGVPDEAVSLMRTIDNKIITSAIENSRHDLVPNVELDDEDSKSMEDKEYARGKAFKSKIARAARMVSLSGTHRLNDYRKGGVGSELYNYGESILDDMGFFIIFQQPDKKAVLGELQERLNLSDADTRELAIMPKYHCAIKIGEEQKLIFGRVIATPNEMELLPTDAANDYMVTRPGFVDESQYEAVGKETGYEYVGGR